MCARVGPQLAKVEPLERALAELRVDAWINGAPRASGARTCCRGALLYPDSAVAVFSLASGASTDEAAVRVCAWLEQRGLGIRKVNYKLRDWLFARQVWLRIRGA